MDILRFDTETEYLNTYYHETYLLSSLGAVVERVINSRGSFRRVIIKPVKQKKIESETIITEQNVRINISEHKIQIGML